MPHALARHNPGDRPSHNVRTAPTPSTEEPVVGPGMTQASQVDPESQSFIGQMTGPQGDLPGGQLPEANQEVTRS